MPSGAFRRQISRPRARLRTAGDFCRARSRRCPDFGSSWHSVGSRTTAYSQPSASGRRADRSDMAPCMPYRTASQFSTVTTARARTRTPAGSPRRCSRRCSQRRVLPSTIRRGVRRPARRTPRAVPGHRRPRSRETEIRRIQPPRPPGGHFRALQMGRTALAAPPLPAGSRSHRPIRPVTPRASASMPRNCAKRPGQRGSLAGPGLSGAHRRMLRMVRVVLKPAVRSASSTRPP